MDWLWTFLGHGGFKLLILALIGAGHLVKQVSKKVPKATESAQKSESAPKPAPVPGQLTQPPTAGTSSLGSPWSNSDAFNEINK
jgi:hypothetical protein